jgi:hypothetical protein
LEAAARANDRVATLLAEAAAAGGGVRRAVVVPGRLVNFVLG